MRDEEKRQREEKKAEEKQLKEDMKSAEKEFKEAQKKSKDQDRAQLKVSQRDSLKKDFPKVDPVAPKTETVELKKDSKPAPTPAPEPEDEVVTFDPNPNKTSEPVQNQKPVAIPQETEIIQKPAPAKISEPVQQVEPIQNPEPVVRLVNPLVTFENFDELAEAVNFVPLYIPKKAGFSIDSMLAIDGRIAEIRYGRRWEPEVSLHVRTCKRAAGEELKDISGVQGVKWRVDMSSGTSVYIAKISENKHVAAWATGDYTFSAQVENLSFAAFHAIVVDELVDLSNHYYIN